MKEYTMSQYANKGDLVADMQTELTTLRAENALLEQHSEALRRAIRECITHHGDYIGSQLFSDMHDLIGGE